MTTLSDIIYNICYLKLKEDGYDSFDLETELRKDSPLGGTIPDEIKDYVRSELGPLIHCRKPIKCNS